MWWCEGKCCGGMRRWRGDKGVLAEDCGGVVDENAAVMVRSKREQSKDRSALAVCRAPVAEVTEVSAAEKGMEHVRGREICGKKERGYLAAQ
eukprot:1478248-Rhodomonas_salina.2